MIKNTQIFKKKNPREKVENIDKKLQTFKNKLVLHKEVVNSFKISDFVNLWIQ